MSSWRPIQKPGRRERGISARLTGGKVNSLAHLPRRGTDMTVNKAIAEEENLRIGPEKARGDVARERRCLRCETVFYSEGFGDRICRRCKGLNAWRNAVAVSPGAARRR